MDTDTPDRRTRAHSSLTPAQRSQRARIAALARHSRTDGRDATQPAREAFMARFERQVDPDNELAPAERARRAELAKREHFQRMAYARHQSA